MARPDGLFTETDILVVGGGAGGMMAALSAKRHAPPGVRVILVDSWQIGRTGHTAFSNAWTVVALPDDDIDAILSEMVAGNDGIADQHLVHRTLTDSYERLREFESYGMVFPRGADGQYIRRPTRGLDRARVMCPEGGGLAFCWQLRLALENAGVELIDRLFVTGLIRDADGRITGAAGIHSRSGQFHAIAARVTIVATNAITFRSGFVRDITGTGTLLAAAAGAALRNAEFGYLRPGTPRFYFEGITFAIQEGARFINAEGERFMNRYEPDWGDEADVPKIAHAMCLEVIDGKAPIYLDMSQIPEDKRHEFVGSKVKWMDYFLRKLAAEADTDMFGKTPYFAQNQMTKMALATGPDCRSDVPGLLASGLAQAGCANHFAGFHIGLCIGNGWVAGESAVEDLDRYPAPSPNPATIEALNQSAVAPLDPAAQAESDRILRELQQLMFAYDVGVLKNAERMQAAASAVEDLAAGAANIAAPHVHELVRLKETEAMLTAARFILGASLFRTETRLSHLRQDYLERDDDNWLVWVDITARDGQPQFAKTPIPTPLCAVARVLAGRPSRRQASNA